MSSVLAAPESRFNKKIDTHSLDKEYLEQDVDDEEWHEDSWEWCVGRLQEMLCRAQFPQHAKLELVARLAPLSQEGEEKAAISPR